MKSLLLVIPILWLISSPLAAQTLSSFDTKLDRLLYENNDYILRFSACLSLLRASVDASKKINKYNTSSCNPETPWDRVYILDSLFYEDLKQKQPELFVALNKLNETCKKVVIDIKMERVDKERLEKHFSSFEQSCQLLQKAATPLVTKLRKDALKTLPKELVDYLNYNYNQFSELRHHLNPNLAGNFPDDLLRKNIENSDSLLVLIQVAATNNQALRLTMDAIDACQNNKKYYLNQLSMKHRFSSEYQNDFYYQIHNHYNNNLVSIVRANYKTPYSLFIPIIPYNNLIASNIPTPAFRFKSIEKTLFEGTVKHWSFKDYDALHNTCEALNRAVFDNVNTTKAIFQLKKEIDSRRERGKGSVKLYHETRLNIGDIEGAIGRLKLNSNETFPIISTQVSNCLALLEDSKMLVELIQIQLEKELWKTDDFAEIIRLMEQYRLLMEQFDEQLIILTKNINKANETKLNAPDNWSKSARILHQYSKELRSEVEIVEDKTLKEGFVDTYNYQLIPQQYENALEQEIPTMAGIKKLGPNNGTCPYYIYERVLTDGWTQHKVAAEPKTDYLEVYLRVIKYHNEAIANFNKFSGQGAERDSDFAKYYHTNPVVNELMLYKPALLPEFKLKPLPQPEPPKIDSTQTPIHEMSRGYLEKCKLNNIIFLVDISSSMNSLDKLERFKKDLIHIKSLMRAEDKISIVTFDGKSRIELKQTPILEQKKWEMVLSNLKSSGRTYFNEGLVLAYEYMNEIVKPEYNNRIVLISDGEFDVNSHSMELVKETTSSKHIAFSALIYNQHAILFPKLLDLTAASTGSYALIINGDDGAGLLFREFSELVGE